MLTSEEITELINNTTRTWITVDGVEGRLFTGNNGNSTFFPQRGYYSSGVNHFESCCNWSSSIYPNDLTGAIELTNNFGISGGSRLGGSSRCQGLPVRGVIG